LIPLIVLLGLLGVGSLLLFSESLPLDSALSHGVNLALSGGLDLLHANIAEENVSAKSSSWLDHVLSGVFLYRGSRANYPALCRALLVRDR
jgi:hypothetical protein